LKVSIQAEFVKKIVQLSYEVNRIQTSYTDLIKRLKLWVSLKLLGFDHQACKAGEMALCW